MAPRPLPRIGFVGSMNAMPMAYALKFRRDGHDVRYVVEAECENHLMRPEHHYASEIPYPYPPWVLEIPWVGTLVRYTTLPWSNRDAVRAMADRDIVFLNDYGIALAPWMSRKALRVALSSGADIDLLCRWEVARTFASGRPRKWLDPARFPLQLWRTYLQRRGLKRAGGLPRLVERFDVNFDAAGVRRLPLVRRPLRKVLVPVRFKLVFPKAGAIEYKGNDLILCALARYRQRQPQLEIHVFEKGDDADLALARQLCRDLGLENCVMWHKTMPLARLMELYADCDICFDQVGSHWMGAVGCYALYMGRPLIANARPDVFDRIWGPDPPILNAKTVDEIHAQLVRCEDFAFRERIAERGHAFARAHLDTEAVYQRLRSTTLELWSDGERDLPATARNPKLT
jgi:glycosyltransferase involved in cell wall biosynthesis